MVEERVSFLADGLNLEGILTYQEDAEANSAVLLCAPHPNLGGDMNNNIITSLAQISADMGYLSLRFNYRGVGNSECHEKDIAGIFQYWEKSLTGGNYDGAIQDTRAALAFLVSQTGIDNIFVAGYSFGAIVGIRVGTESDRVKAFAAISTPFGKYPIDFLQHCHKPKLFVYSRNDFATTEEEALRCFAVIPPPKKIELIQGSDHFYRGQEEVISRKVCEFFRSNSGLDII